MQKSYVQEQSINVKTDIDLGEINRLIEVLDAVIESDSSNWKAQEMVRKLKEVRRGAVLEARDQFDSLLNNV